MDPLRLQFEVIDGRDDSLHHAKHGGEARAEEHDEEENGPYLQAWHLEHCFGEYDKNKAST